MGGFGVNENRGDYCCGFFDLVDQDVGSGE